MPSETLFPGVLDPPMNALERLNRAIFGRAVLAPVAVGMIAGIAVADRFAPPTTISILMFGFPCVLACSRRARRHLGVLLVGLAAAGMGSARYEVRVGRIAPDHVVYFAQEPFTLARVTGMVIGEPRFTPAWPYEFSRWSRARDRFTFLLEVESIEGRRGAIPASGRLRVTLGEPLLDLQVGDRVEAFGRLYPFRPPANPGAFDWTTYLRRQGVLAGLTCDFEQNVKVLAPPSWRSASSWWNRFSSWLSRVRYVAGQWLVNDLPGADVTETGLLQAVVLGQRSSLDRSIDALFLDLGCSHLLAVSGMHVGAVMLGFWLLGRLLTLPRRGVTLFVLSAVVAYTLVVEPRPPVLRAGLMAGAWCLARLGSARPRAINILAVTAGVILLFDPAQAFSIGFQLSFVPVLGLILLVPAGSRFLKEAAYAIERLRYGDLGADVRRRLKSVASSGDGGLFDAFDSRPPIWRRVIRGGKTALKWGVWIPGGISLVAWLSSAPLIALHFGQIQGAGSINTVLIFPFVWMLVNLGFLALAVEWVAPSIAFLLKWPLVGIERLGLVWAEWLAERLRWNVMVPPIPWWLMTFWYITLALFAWRFKPVFDPSAFDVEGGASPVGRVKPTALKRWAGRAACVGVVAVAGGSAIWPWAPRSAEHLVVTALSVGRGSAAVVELPDGRTFLFDAGSDRPLDPGALIIAPYLQSRGIRRVDRVYISHPNLDHFSGVPGLMDAMRVGPIVVTPYFEPLAGEDSPARHLLNRLEAWGHPVETLDLSRPTWREGEVEFEVLWPTPETPNSFSANDTSLVLRLTWRGWSILLTGDVEDDAQRRLLERGDLKSDVLLIPHHGSPRASSAAFFDAVGATYGIQSARDSEGELSSIAGGMVIYNTARRGAVTLEIRPEGLAVRGQWTE